MPAPKPWRVRSKRAPPSDAEIETDARTHGPFVARGIA